LGDSGGSRGDGGCIPAPAPTMHLETRHFEVQNGKHFWGGAPPQTPSSVGRDTPSPHPTPLRLGSTTSPTNDFWIRLYVERDILTGKSANCTMIIEAPASVSTIKMTDPRLVIETSLLFKALLVLAHPHYSNMMTGNM